MRRPNGWKIVSRAKPDDPWPVLRYYHGVYAERDARRKMAELAEAGIRARLFERVDGRWVERQ